MCSQPWKGFIHRSPRQRLGECENKICALEGHLSQPTSVPKCIFQCILYQCTISAVFLMCPFRAHNLIFAPPRALPGATMDMPFQGSSTAYFPNVVFSALVGFLHRSPGGIRGASHRRKLAAAAASACAFRTQTGEGGTLTFLCLCIQQSPPSVSVAEAPGGRAEGYSSSS